MSRLNIVGLDWTAPPRTLTDVAADMMRQQQQANAYANLNMLLPLFAQRAQELCTRLRAEMHVAWDGGPYGSRVERKLDITLRVPTATGGTAIVEIPLRIPAAAAIHDTDWASIDRAAVAGVIQWLKDNTGWQELAGLPAPVPVRDTPEVLTGEIRTLGDGEYLENVEYNKEDDDDDEEDDDDDDDAASDAAMWLPPSPTGMY